MPVQNLRPPVVISLHGLDSAFCRAVGFVSAVQKPRAEFVVVLGRIDNSGNEFIVTVLGQVNFGTARRSRFYSPIDKIFEN